MNIYRITVRETSLVEYSIEANNEDEARKLLYMGDQQVVNDRTVAWDCIEIEECKS